MELAGRVYDVVTESTNLHDKIRDYVPPKSSPEHLYWRRALRMAALCHDIGHLPFSHAAEDLLPSGWDHERITVDLIRSPDMQEIWADMTPPLRTEDVVKLAVGPKKIKDADFSDWETILSEIIVGDAFGVDRMDYLLRDSYHAGVTYGTFDRYRLIDTLRILPREDLGSSEPVLGLEEGGLHSAEALILARYFMYQQVYFHPVRLIYDIHLKDFLKAWLPGGCFSIDMSDHLKMTDLQVTAAILDASSNPELPGHDSASHIVDRTHFKLLYGRNAIDQWRNLEAAKAVSKAACERYGQGKIRSHSYTQKEGSPDFPVLKRDGRIVSSLNESEALNRIPVAVIDFVFVDRAAYGDASTWLKQNRDEIISKQEAREE